MAVPAYGGAEVVGGGVHGSPEVERRIDIANEQPPPRQDGYDLSRHEDRVARVLDRLEGRISAADADLVSGDGYNPSETTEWQPEEEW